MSSQRHYRVNSGVGGARRDRYWRAADDHSHVSRAMRVILEFFGGPHDGEVLVNESASLQSAEMQRLCRQCRCAEVGQRINWPTEYAETILATCSDAAINDFIEIGCRFPYHTYEVLGLFINGPEFRVRLQHTGAATNDRESLTFDVGISQKDLS